MNMKKDVFETWIMNIILFLYPFEVFTIVHVDNLLGPLSPYRAVIFPLCLLFIMKNAYSRDEGVAGSNMIVAIYFFFCFLGILVPFNSSAFISLVGSMAQFYCAYQIFLHKNISKSTLFVITTWGFLQIPALVDAIILGNFGMANRFMGYFFDPNYLCAFCVPSFTSSFYLLQSESKRIYRCYLYIVAVFSLILVFLTFSRGAMLALIFSIAIYLLIHNKKLLVAISVLLIPIISYMKIRSLNLTWADGADNLLDGFIYRTFTLSGDMNELTAGRADYFETFLENINDYMLWGMDVFSYFKQYNDGHFIHNGIAELCVQSGVVVGLIFVLCLVIANMRTIIRYMRLKTIPPEYLIFASSLLCLTFLSYTSKYSWLCIGVLFALTKRGKIVCK